MLNRSFAKIARSSLNPRLNLARATPINNRRSSGTRALITTTLTSNGSWTAPAGVRVLVRVYGKGGPGTADQSYTVTIRGYHMYGQLFYQYVPGPWQVGDYIDYGWTEGYPVPTPSSTGVIADGPDYNYKVDYTYTEENHYDYYSVPPAAGPGAAIYGPGGVSLGLTFPGGAPAAAANITNYTGVDVTPGITYNFVVPTGGFITIEYFGL